MAKVSAVSRKGGTGAVATVKSASSDQSATAENPTKVALRRAIVPSRLNRDPARHDRKAYPLGKDKPMSAGLPLPSVARGAGPSTAWGRCTGLSR
ncbi:hypothetical protein MASR1M49_23630 [Pararhodobacter aggregans]